MKLRRQDQREKPLPYSPKALEEHTLGVQRVCVVLPVEEQIGDLGNAGDGTVGQTTVDATVGDDAVRNEVVAEEVFGAEAIGDTTVGDVTGRDGVGVSGGQAEG